MALSRREFCREVAAGPFLTAAMPAQAFADVCARIEEVTAVAPSSIAEVAGLLRLGRKLVDAHFVERSDGSFDATHRMWDAIHAYKEHENDEAIFSYMQSEAEADFHFQRALLSVVQQAIGLVRSSNEYQSVSHEIERTRQAIKRARGVWSDVAHQRGRGPKEDVLLPLPPDEQAKEKRLFEEVQELLRSESALERQLAAILGFESADDESWSDTHEEVLEISRGMECCDALGRMRPRDFQQWNLFLSHGMRNKCAAVDCAAQAMHRTRERLEHMAMHVHGEDFKTSGMLVRLVPRVRSLCFDLSRTFFPDVSAQDLRETVYRLEQEDRAGTERVQRKMDKARREIEEMFSVPYVDDDRLYMRLHRIRCAQRAAWEAEQNRRYKLMIGTEEPLASAGQDQ